MCKITIIYFDESQDENIDVFNIEDELAYQISSAVKSKNNETLKKLFLNLVDSTNNIHSLDINNVKNFNLEPSTT